MAFMIPLMLGAAALGKVLGGASQGASAGRQLETQNNATQDTQRTTQYGINQQAILDALKQAESANMNRATLDLNQRNFALNAPTTRMSQSARGSMLANAQDLQISHPRAHIPTITGGMRPSALSPETRQLGALVARQTLMSQMKGDTFDAVPQQNWQGGVVAPPGVTPQPQASGLEKWGGIAGILGNLAGAGVSAYQQAIGQQANSPLTGATSSIMPVTSGYDPVAEARLRGMQFGPQGAGSQTAQQGGWSLPQF